jgi:sarcosine oxidase
MGPPFAGMLKVQRQTLFWFEPEDEAMYRVGRFPVFIWLHGGAAADVFYGFPLAPGQGGVKVATEKYDTESDPDQMERTVSAAEAAQMHARHVLGRLRGVTSRLLAAAACPYTVAPQARFVVVRPETVPHAIVVSACSGHGFKHSAALGEALAQQVLEGGSAISLKPFGLAGRSE